MAARSLSGPSMDPSRRALKDDEVWRLAAEDTGEVPLDVILVEPGREFADLYRLVDVRSARDVRVSMPAQTWIS